MTNLKHLGMLAALLSIGVGGTYAFAQAKPAPAKPAASKAAAPAEAACDCAACQAAGHEAGMHGGAKMGMGECPMMQDRMPMMGMTVKVVNTKQGATLELVAKLPADTAKVQQMAQTMAKHLETGCKMMPRAESGSSDTGGGHDRHKH